MPVSKKPSASRPQSAEMHPGPGFRMRVEVTRPSLEAVEALRRFDTPDISDLMNRLYAMNPTIRNLTDDRLTLAGPACTVKVYPGDNLMVHKALDIAAPGDVIVVDTNGSSVSAALGDLISTKARHRGIAGFVVDGLIRDLPGIQALGDFPVFARGATPVGPLHRGPGEINYPICAGGIVVHPGDVIVGDPSGVVVVPLEIIEDVLRRLAAAAEAGATYVAAVARGEFTNDWVDSALEGSGVVMPAHPSRLGS